MTPPTGTIANSSTLEPMVRKLEYHGAFSSADRAALLALPFTLRTLERQHFVVRDRKSRPTRACF